MSLQTFTAALARDIKFAVRSLRRTPIFVVVTVATLSIGVAALASVFSYYYAVYHARLPFGDADRIVAVHEQRRTERYAFSSVSLDALEELRRGSRSFDAVSAYREETATLHLGTRQRSISMLAVDSAFVRLVDLHAVLGGVITAADIRGGSRVVMISDQLWRSEYGSSPDVIGRRMSFGGERYEVLGVLPPGWRFPWQTDVIGALRFTSSELTAPEEIRVSAIARLRSGATRADARREAALIADRLATGNPQARAGLRLVVRDEMLDRHGRRFLPQPSLFLSAGLLVLLIACANVINIFYVRAAEHKLEMALRSALGASRRRLIGQGLVETALLAGAAIVLGTIGARLLLSLWLHYVPTQGFPSWFRISTDIPALSFTACLLALVTLCVGVAPAFEGSRFDLASMLKHRADTGSSHASISRRARRGLVVELALSVALFVAASLLLRSFRSLGAIDLGYEPSEIAVLRPAFDSSAYASAEAIETFVSTVVSQSALVPQVTAVAERGRLLRFRTEPDGPIQAVRGSRFDRTLVPDRNVQRANATVALPDVYVVSDGFFDVIGLRIRSGRVFDTSDVEGAVLVAVISESVARSLWGNSSAIGQTLQIGRAGLPMNVVGVVDDMRELRGFDSDPRPTVYTSRQQGLTDAPEILARGKPSSLAIRDQIISVAHQVDPMVVFGSETTLASQFDQALLVTRVFGSVIAAFAAGALLLSTVGIYGVIAHSITRRRREIGIRLAIGGSPHEVVSMITRESIGFVAIGLAAGLCLGFALSQLLKGVLYGVSSSDPTTYAVVAVFFGGVSAAAVYFPARRAARVDPLIALRGGVA